MHTLYWARGACSIAPHIALEEIGEPYDLKEVVIDMKGTAEVLVDDQYLKVNPKGRVPALSTATGVLTETPAILMFLARTHPRVELLPADAAQESRVIEWLSYLSTAVHAIAFSQIIRPQRLTQDQKNFPDVIAKGRENVRKAYSYIEAQLQAKQWACGERYSIVDIYLLFFYLGSKSAGTPMEKFFPAWTTVANRALDRPAVKSVLKQEGLVVNQAVGT